MKDIDIMLNKLSKSKFRSGFKLTRKMNDYITEKGIDVIEKHAEDFLSSRLKKYNPEIDGKQTPMKNHPVFIAQHATACCCRGCLEKWYQIPKTRDLTDEEIDYFKQVIMKWIISKYERK